MELELKQIKELMSAMEKADCSRMRLKLGDNEIELERKKKGPEAPHATPPPPPTIHHAEAAAPPPPPAAASSGKFVTAPMVGTFYGSPSPEAAAYVKVGDTVKEDSVVCIIEAMKVMNEVKAGVSGVVREVLIDAGHPVEFGTKLFRVE